MRHAVTTQHGGRQRRMAVQPLPCKARPGGLLICQRQHLALSLRINREKSAPAACHQAVHAGFRFFF